MPPSPRNSPALEVALSRDTRRPGDHGWRAGNREPWEFLFGSGEWRDVTVRAWWADDRGREVVQVSWHAEMDTWRGEFIVDRERMREGDAE
jgi:hypothetical protein